MEENPLRTATIVRETSESKVSVEVNLDGTGKAEINTPVGFLNHTVEDTAIVLGRAIDEALGERRGIVRMADRTCPLDEALTQAVLDLSGRGYAVVNMRIDNNVGEFPADLARHFFETIAIEGRFCLHIRVLTGQNEHHVIESAFKAFARSLRDASRIDERNPDAVPSTKGTLTE